jgi:2-hydroxy-3-keto-5-methylthiopentenyl-1-phosphate phosphatase
MTVTKHDIIETLARMKRPKDWEMYDKVRAENLALGSGFIAVLKSIYDSLEYAEITLKEWET